MVPVDVNGAKVHPGDLVVADAGGVIFVPQDRLIELEQRLDALTS